MGPLVSVGIPTYNRPEGLTRTLRSISLQTYQNLQIIVADNCSGNPDVRVLAEEFANIDPRIIYFRHNENKGAAYNFKFVLEKADGKYFMWAADDDEWHPEFISELISLIGDYSAAFCNYSLKKMPSEEVVTVNVGMSASGKDKYEQARNYLIERVPSMFYSMYRTEHIKWIIKYNKIFDWQDCFVVLKIILLYNGYVISNKNLYTVGILGATYSYKPAFASNKRLFTYMPYFRECLKVIIKSKLTMNQKIKLISYLFDVNFKSFIKLESNRKSYHFYSWLFGFYTRLSPIKNIKRLF